MRILTRFLKASAYNRPTEPEPKFHLEQKLPCYYPHRPSHWAKTANARRLRFRHLNIPSTIIIYIYWTQSKEGECFKRYVYVISQRSWVYQQKTQDEFTSQCNDLKSTDGSKSVNVPPNIFADFCSMKTATTNANIHFISFAIIAGKLQFLFNDYKRTESVLKLMAREVQACFQTSIAL